MSHSLRVAFRALPTLCARFFLIIKPSTNSLCSGRPSSISMILTMLSIGSLLLPFPSLSLFAFAASAFGLDRDSEPVSHNPLSPLPPISIPGREKGSRTSSSVSSVRLSHTARESFRTTDTHSSLLIGNSPDSETSCFANAFK